MNNREVSVECFPPQPYVEAGETGQVLHIDFKLTNRTTKVVELQELVTSVMADGEVIYRRHIDQNGLPSALSTVPGLPVAPGGSVTIFNPLERFPRDLPLASVTYKFVLGTPGTAARWERSIELSPRSMPTGPELVLPLRGRLLVYEAHDYYGHHRRLDTQHPMVRDLGLTSNSGRFSYDLSLVDVNGRMFRGDGTRNDDWYSWEQAVLAAGSGVVVACANDRQDFEIGAEGFQIPSAPLRDTSVFLGNYVTIRHSRGVYSMTGHLRSGSLRVDTGQHVMAGDQLGRVGFSGSCVTVHTHFQLQAGASFNSEGIPSNFTAFRRLRGAKSTNVRRGAVESGDIVRSLA